MAFAREVKGNQVIVIANFGQETYEPTFNIPGTKYTNAFTAEVIEGPVPMSIAPGEFVVLTK